MKKQYIIPTISVVQLENVLTLGPGSPGVNDPGSGGTQEYGGDEPTP